MSKCLIGFREELNKIYDSVKVHKPHFELENMRPANYLL